MSDPERELALLVAEVLATEAVGRDVGDEPGERIEWVEMYGMACVRVTLADRRTLLVEVNEGPLA